MRILTTLARRSTVLAAASILVGCRSEPADLTGQGATGSCTIREPGSPPAGGIAAYVDHVTPTVVGGFGVGSLAVTVTCLTTGTVPDEVMLILPNLQRGKRVMPGDYIVRNPYDPRLSQAELTSPQLAWVRVRRGGDVPVLYVGEGGRVTLTRAGAGSLEGAYQVALAEADGPVTLPGARPEVSGPMGIDSTRDRVRSRTVFGGAFVAPRTEASWRGR